MFIKTNKINVSNFKLISEIFNKNTETNDVKMHHDFKNLEKDTIK